MVIQNRGKALEGEPATIRAALIAAGLLEQLGDNTYTRPMLKADHPAFVQLREEALARQRQ